MPFQIRDSPSAVFLPLATAFTNVLAYHFTGPTGVGGGGWLVGGGGVGALGVVGIPKTKNLYGDD